jgi:hypothetical protein
MSGVICSLAENLIIAEQIYYTTKSQFVSVAIVQTRQQNVNAYIGH